MNKSDSIQLVIDVGNSRLKWNTVAGSLLLQDTCAVAWRESYQSSTLISDFIPQLDHAWSGLENVSAVWISNVANKEIEGVIGNWTQQHWGIAPQYVKSQPSQLGVTNGYADYRQLGVDRWLCLLAAWQLFPEQATCVVNCGTAITVDVLSEQGQHLGGIIAPGLSLLRESLNSILPGSSVQANDFNPVSALDLGDEPTLELKREQKLGQKLGQQLGHSTEECIIAGIVSASVASVNAIITSIMQMLTPTMQIVVTGGNAEVFMSALTSDTRHSTPTLHYPDLVLQGLIRVMENSPCE